MIRSLNATATTGVLLVLLLAAIILSGPVGLRPEPQSAEAAFLSEVKKLLASDAQAFDRFGSSVAVSGDTAVVGPVVRMPGASTPARPTSSGAMRAARTTGAR